MLQKVKIVDNKPFQHIWMSMKLLLLHEDAVEKKNNKVIIIIVVYWL